jgi:hypothetical protein
MRLDETDLLQANKINVSVQHKVYLISIWRKFPLHKMDLQVRIKRSSISDVMVPII